MSHYLLTGAGFSRNWGGWLANEVFEYLLGAAEVDDKLRSILWDAKLRGEGFEDALAVVQAAYMDEKGPEAKKTLDRLTQAVIGMFVSMQDGFDSITKPNPRSDMSLQEFLAKFDVIFTLNQDTLLETIYAGKVRWSERWYGSFLPFMKFVKEPDEAYPYMLRELLTEDLNLTPDPDYQPIYKLHGSYNWLADPKEERLIIIGGNKRASIEKFPVLARYHLEFQHKLMESWAFIMIIGYSFGDPHINSVIMKAVNHGLKLFIVDLSGADVIDKRNNRGQIAEPVSDMMQTLIPGIIGASRRPLFEIMSRGTVENGKILRFFEAQVPISRISQQS
jgi:hypothetical protein